MCLPRLAKHHSDKLILMPIEEALLLVAIIAVVFTIIWWLDQRVKKRGPLFSGPPSLQLKILALVLGFLFGALFVFYLSKGSLSIPFIIVSVALIAYGLGWDRLL